VNWLLLPVTLVAGTLDRGTGVNALVNDLRFDSDFVTASLEALLDQG
jgi:hypothetical protein